MEAGKQHSQESNITTSHRSNTNPTTGLHNISENVIYGSHKILEQNAKHKHFVIQTWHKSNT